MKNPKKILALLLAVVMVLAMAAPAMADKTDDREPGTITINNAVDGQEYDLFRMFDLTGKDTNEDGNFDAYAYTVNAKWVDFFFGNESIEAAKDEAGNLYLIEKTTANAETYAGFNELTYDGKTYFMNITKDTQDKGGNVVPGNVTELANDALEYIMGGKVVTDLSVTGSKDGANRNINDNNTLVIDDLPLGYYVVFPKDANIENEYYKGSVCALTSTDPETEIYIKAEKPTIDKIIDDGDTTTPRINEASIGDKVPYKVTTKVPTMDKYTKFFFIVNDTMTKGLTFNDDVVIKMTDKNGENEITLTADVLNSDDTVTKKDYSVTSEVNGTSGETAITIVFRDFIGYAEYTPEGMSEAITYEGGTVVITYSATLNEDAVMSPSANVNEVNLDYSNNPTVTPESSDEDDDVPKYGPGESGSPVGETGTIDTKTYTTKLQLNKVDGTTTDKTPLSGAKFSLTGDSATVEVINSTIFEVEDADFFKTKVTDGSVEVYDSGDNKDLPKMYYRLKDGNYTTEAPTLVDVYEEITDAMRAEGSLNGEYSLKNGEYIVRVDGDEGPFYTLQKGVNLEAYDYDPAAPVVYAKVLKVDKNTTASSTTKEAYVSSESGKVGQLLFEGLGEGIYTITETEAPDGYNKLTESIYVYAALEPYIGTDGNPTNEYHMVIYQLVDATVDADGKPTKFMAVDGSTWTNSSEKAKKILSETFKDDGTLDSADVDVVIPVENKTGTELPETGGIGTTIFIAVGALVMVGAGVFFVTNQRMRKEGF